MKKKIRFQINCIPCFMDIKEKKLHFNEVKVYFLCNQWQRPLVVPPIPPLYGVWLNWLCRAAGDLCEWLSDAGSGRRCCGSTIVSVA